MQKIRLTLILCLILALNCYSQISHGGFPLEVQNLKSTSFNDRVVRMPLFDVSKELNSLELLNNQKSLKFAHSFAVSLSPENSGTWFEIDGYKVWQLMIKSDGAYSLNIIFSKYYIPDGARLFVFDPEQKIVLGAFTSENNKSYKKLAIYPLPGDQLLVQYEEPLNAAFKGELEIGEINHDFKGVFSYNNRWKRRPSESCNIDVNCEFESKTEDQRRAVCRIIAGDELGTGTLMNNVLKNKKPYLLSALHIYDDEKTAKTALYDFNYESPFCTELNGSDIQSVSGSVAVAAFDSVDMILVELSEMPPPTYRPYLAGWNATNLQPFNSYVIHHPNGDTKKISHDSGKCDSVRYNSNYIKNGHWKVYNWEIGATEGGSSGASLFDNDKRVVGILSGGNATCEEITFDLFSRLDKMWNYRSEYVKQLKCWLAPGQSVALQLDGLDPYLSTTNECTLISNFMIEDTALVIPSPNGSGYLSGNNGLSITEVAEKFAGYEKAVINGVSIGISRFKVLTGSPDITIRIYSGTSSPDFAEKQFKFPMNSLTADAMNYFVFSEPVEVKGSFFVSVVVPESDSLVLFQSDMRPLVADNTMLVLQDGVWKTVSEVVGKTTLGSSLLMQVMVCDASIIQSTDSTKQDNLLFKAYPNPASEYLVVEFKERSPQYELWLYDMTGKLIMNECYDNRLYGEINVSGLQTGIYLIRVSNGATAEVGRVIIN